jgi:hypothetical protein
LPAHLERVIARLTALRTGPRDNPTWSDAIEIATRRVDALLAPARKARGEAREAILETLARVDADLLDQAAHAATPDLLAQASADAATELAPFRARVSPADYAAALERGRLRALRQHLGLPTIPLD